MRTEVTRLQFDDEDISTAETALIVSSLSTLLVTLVAFAQNF